jgi:hypothetical protein
VRKLIPFLGGMESSTLNCTILKNEARFPGTTCSRGKAQFGAPVASLPIAEDAKRTKIQQQLQTTQSTTNQCRLVRAGIERSRSTKA